MAIVTFLLFFTGGEGSQLVSPISPSELLIALHSIDCKGDDALMKAVVRGGCGHYISIGVDYFPCLSNESLFPGEECLHTRSFGCCFATIS